MPRPSKGARLYLRKRTGREPVFVILDGTYEIGTGCGAGDRAGAEKAFAEYLARKHKPDFGNGNPSHVAVANVMVLYGEAVAPQLAHPELVGFHMQRLLEHFGKLTCAQVAGATCRAYVEKRMTGKIGPRPVSQGTARRELETLAAALTFAFKEKALAVPVPVTFPPRAPRRERWLTRPETARLLAGALGWCAVAYDVATRKPCKWHRLGKPSYHVARFILIGLYTGTRHEAILQLRWVPSTVGGWIDFEHGMLYRRGEGERETNKRRPPIPLPPSLMLHLKRARRHTVQGPVEYDGKLIAKERRGFARARQLAHLGNEVTPHVLRHTCATWLLQARQSTWDVANWLGTSEKVIRDVYGHHSPDHLSGPANAFFGRKLGKSAKEA